MIFVNFFTQAPIPNFRNFGNQYMQLNTVKYYQMLSIKYYRMLSIKYYRILSNARILCQGAGGQCVQIARKVRRMRSNVEFWLLVFRYPFYQLRNVSKKQYIGDDFFLFFLRDLALFRYLFLSSHKYLNKQRVADDFFFKIVQRPGIALPTSLLLPLRLLLLRFSKITLYICKSFVEVRQHFTHKE